MFDSTEVEKVTKSKKRWDSSDSLWLFIVVGTLMGYDPLLNLVLDNTTEYQKGLCYLYVKVANLLPSVDLETGYITENKRELGLSVLRGTAIILISPFDGMEEIENPFAQ